MTTPIPRLNAALSGRYMIERELGEGGMATVYLADDERHERKVALKVLKPELAAIVGAERFLAEIKTTAGLQHPHILPLHDSGEADGFLFYVMPYVEGESLRQKLDREHQLPVDEAVRIAENVGEALDYAHRRGVIHRDIKPANILLQDGKPVVSDFGIALALGAAGRGRLTETGLSLGTPHYMSPEQATGDMSIGAATDVYALGCVLYEMLVGEPPYTGSTPQAVLGRIVTGEPRSVMEERSTVPAHVDAVVRRALEKVPADRFGAAGEMVRALGDTGFRWGEAPRAADDAGGKGDRVWQRTALGIAALALLLAAGLTASLLSDSGTPPLRHVQVLLQDDAPPSEGANEGLSASPDGDRILYSADGGQGPRVIRARLLSERGSDVAIPGTEGSGSFDLSPSGDSIVFNHAGDAALKVVSVSGGQPTTIAPTGLAGGIGGFIGVSWGPDGTIVFATTRSGLQRVSASGGAPLELTEAGFEEVTIHRQPRILPDGSGVVFTITDDSEALSRGQRIAVLPWGGEIIELTEGHSPRVTASGVLVLSRGADGDLWAARMASDWTTLVSEPVPVLDAAPHTRAQNYLNARYTLAEDGTLLFLPIGTFGDSDPDPLLAWVDRDGRQDTIVELPRVPNATGGFQGPRVSPNGTQISFRSNVAGEPSYGLFVWDLEGAAISRVRSDINADWPAWLDDERIIFNHFSSEGQELYIARVDGTEDPEPWTSPNPLQQHVNHVLADRDSMVIQQRPSIEHPDSDLWLVPIDGQGPGRPLVTDPGTEVQGTVDPTGRWLAYASNRSGQFEVYVTEFPDSRTHRQVSNEGGESPVWNPAGGELLYRSRGAGREMWALVVETDPVFQVESRELLFEGDFNFCCGPTGGWARTFDVSRDGQRLLMIPVVRESDEVFEAARVPRIEMIQGWLGEVERRLGGR